MFRYVSALMLVCAASFSFATKSERAAFASVERCLAPVEIAHGAIDLAFCEDLLASATLRPEFHTEVAKRVARVRAERADMSIARAHLETAMTMDPLDESLPEDFAGLEARHAQFVSAWQGVDGTSHRIVANLNAND